MIKKIFTLIFIISIKLLYSQNDVLGAYPSGQNFYTGGIRGLEMDMIQIVKDKKLTPCSDSGQKYKLKVIVNADSSVNYVKDFDTINIGKNKCAFDFSRKIIPSLSKWIPAKENNVSVRAIAEISIDPFFLYYSKNDPYLNKKIEPKFKRGKENFSFDLKEIFESYIEKNQDKYASVTFVVNEQGLMENFVIEGDYPDSDKKNIIRELSKIKGKWEPATFNGIPVKSKMRQAVRQQYSFEYEKERIESNFNNQNFRSR